MVMVRVSVREKAQAELVELSSLQAALLRLLANLAVRPSALVMKEFAVTSPSLAVMSRLMADNTVALALAQVMMENAVTSPSLAALSRPLEAILRLASAEADEVKVAISTSPAA